MSRPFPGPRGLAHARVMGVAGEDVRAALDVARVDHGDAFVFGFGGIRFHWFLGLDGAHLLLRDAVDAFGNADAYPFLGPVGGATALIATDDPEHLRRRRLVQPAFHKSLLVGWAELAAERFDALVGELLREGPQPLHPRLRPVVLEVVLDILLGPVARQRHPGLLADVLAMMDYANLPMLEQLLKLPLPTSPWGRFLAARRRADGAIRAEIRAHQTGANADLGGVVGMLVNSHPPLQEDEIRDQALSLVSAGFDTSSAAISWMASLLADPRFGGPAAAELAEVTSPAAASAAPFAGALFQEALRLYPPAPAILRRVLRPVEWQGHRLPKGGRVALSLWHLHRDERLWHAPGEVEPRRWSERQGPWAAPAEPFAFLPFGHGGRYCIGAGLARTLTLAFAWSALRRARWSLIDVPPRPVGVTLVPHDGLPLRWRSVD
jgi:cytochrome P450